MSQTGGLIRILEVKWRDPRGGTLRRHLAAVIASVPATEAAAG